MACRNRWCKTAQDRGLPVLDATCPLVSKVHNQGKRYVAKGRTLILIGHAGHPEVEGTMGQVGAPVHLVQSEGRCRHPGAAGQHAGRLYHPDHAFDRRHQGHHRRVEEALLRHRRPGNLGHLLRHPEPPDLGARTGQGRRCDPGGGGAEYLQLQPPARNRHRGRHSLLSDRRRQRTEAGMGARQEGGGPDRRRQRPGRTGAPCDRRRWAKSKTSKWNRWTARRNISSSACRPN